MTGHIEHEIKLTAPEACALPSLSDVAPGMAEGPSADLELDAVYFDTRDLALARSGITLRHRRGEPGPPWTVKLPHAKRDSALTRLEVGFDGPDDVVPREASALLRAYLRSRRLHPVARIHTARHAVPVADPNGTDEADYVDDRVTGTDALGRSRTFREVEVEIRAATPARAHDIAKEATRRLLAAGCAPGAAVPKLVRVLGDEAVAPPDLRAVPLPKRPTVGDVVAHAMSTAAERIVAHDPGVRLGEDPEEVHQFRVATRTLRSHLAAFAPILDAARAERLDAELAWLADVAGAVRDLDVLNQWLQGARDSLDPDDLAAHGLLVEVLRDQHEQARAALSRALAGRRYGRLLTALVHAAGQPPTGEGAPTGKDGKRFLERAARKQVSRLSERVAALPPAPTDTDLHRIRIQGKRARYSVEAARPVGGKPAGRHAAALAALQDVLGGYHDMVTTTHWLREVSADRPAVGLVAGQLIAVARTEKARLRASAPQAWQDATRPGLSDWLEPRRGHQH